MSAIEPEAFAPRARRVLELADQAGFALSGIAPAEACAHPDWVRQWLAAGKHGEMAYLAERVELRLDPAKLLPGACSVIVVADAYGGQWPSGPEGPRAPGIEGPSDRGAEEAKGEPSTTSEFPSPKSEIAKLTPPTGRITSYARGKDYHKTIKKRLHRLADDLRARHPEASFKCTVDTAPTLEREHATRAGLGWAGKHTLLIHPTHGSYFFLGCILTDLALQTSAEAGHPGQLLPPSDHCGTCTRCIDACPTQCIDDPDETGHRSIDASRCISYLTIEHRSTIDVSMHEAMGDWLAGCDVCQDVCPFNRDEARPFEATPKAGAEASEASRGSEASDASNQRAAFKLWTPTGLPVHERYTPELPARLSLLEILDWAEGDYQQKLKGNALKRIKLAMWKRNALIVAGNQLARGELDASQAAALHERIACLAGDEREDQLVYATANQVIDRLRRAPDQPHNA